MHYWLLALTTLCSAGKSIICKKIGTSENSSRNVFAWNGIIYSIASVMAFLSLYPNFDDLLHISPFSLVLAVVFASLLLFTQVTEIFAMALGSISMTILIFSGGFLLPIGYGCFFLEGDARETVSLLCGIGIVLMIVAMTLIIRPRKEGAVSPKWVLMSLLAMLGSGSVAIVQKIHQKADHAAHADEIHSFVMLGLLFAAVLSFAAALITRKHHTAPAPLSRRDVVFLLFSGVCIGLLNMLNLFLAGKLPAAVHFPVYNLGSMLLTALFGIAVLKEKYTVWQRIGFVVGCVSIVLLGL